MSADPFLIPDPYLPFYPSQEIARVWSSNNQSAVAGAITSIANRAVYVPTIFPCDVTLTAIRVVAQNGTGNYDLGLYNSGYTRLVSSGSIAMSAAGVKTLSVAGMRLRGGELYFTGVWLSSTSGQLMRWLAIGATVLTASRFSQETNASGLPATATPVAQVDTFTPVLAFGVR